jgi:transcriptional regulator with XRE-family HTH domain
MTGLKLKLARVERRVKQIDVSRVTGIPTSRLSLIENGYADARPDELAAICSALKLDEPSGALEAKAVKG